MLEFLQKNILLVAAAAGSGAMLLWPLIRGGAAGTVTTLQATQLINRQDALVLDVRDAAAYAGGHILGARNLPVARIDEKADLGKRKDRPLIVYCDSGARASKAAAALRQQGYTQVVNLAGGLGAWQAAGLPVEK